ncbi:DUF4198 domain-containing protein [Poritiphilus flavus]|uniref:DUF4198 domain-containing protein n=1 Tax=Poritiphilus flavus TaxID=2697053 RepID=A0A6L9EHF9_9FLAO|nr:DUF4198 domain-containing protein [Poritiphilus flavus]NAS14082.1 DUF4198 domain-containing protein [Poritiphilus flavus]
MKKIGIALFAFLLFSSHDMFLKLDDYVLPANTSASIRLFNGTFQKSENTIDRNRMLDVSLLGEDKRFVLDSTQWRESDNETILDFKTGAEGTWIAGVSTLARNIEMNAADFNKYLEHDGVLDMLEWRKNNNALDKDAVEKYSKHVKTIFQVGDKKTDDWKTALDYPIEFIPLSNPYEIHAGHEMQVKLLWQGKPLADQLVYVGLDEAQGHSHDTAEADGTEKPEEAHSHDTGSDAATSEQGHSHSHSADHEHSHSADHEHSDKADHKHTHDHDKNSEHKHSHEHGHEHDKDDAKKHSHKHGHDHGETSDHTHSHDQEAEPVEEEHSHEAVTQLRTDAAGVINVKLTSDGVWYLRTIHLVHSKEEGLTHESNWATLTFAVGQGDHSHAEGEDHHHEHDEEHSHEIPSYVYWIASLLVFGGLFLWFNRKAK